jgi:Glyoxalase-like domain
MAIHLRQIALVAADLEPVVTGLERAFDLDVCFRDPGVATFGLVNALLPVGNDFLEVVSPDRPGTTAGRLLERRGGDGGYMVILQCDEQPRLASRLEGLGVRAVWNHDGRRTKAVHLHPRDVGGAILSLDWMADPKSWEWAGPTWADHVRTRVVNGFAGVTIGANDPSKMAARWAEVLDRDATGDSVALDGSTVHFVAAGERGEGVDGVDLLATDRAAVGNAQRLGGVRFRLV